jgi:hypothetical protein
MGSNQERMDGKIGSQIKTIQGKLDIIQENMDYGQEQMRPQVGSLASRINANQEEMSASVSAIQYKI